MTLASFPNSRIKPRNATTNASTKKTQVNFNGEAAGTVLADGGVVSANGNTLVVSPNANQTYIYLRNGSNADRMYYAYEDKPNIITGLGANGGNFLEPGEAIDLETSNESIYARMDSSTTRANAHFDLGEG
jgi:hypothetical protein